MYHLLTAYLNNNTCCHIFIDNTYYTDKSNYDISHTDISNNTQHETEHSTADVSHNGEPT